MFFLEAQIGLEVKNLRAELKLTKEKLARLSQIDVKTLRKIERGKRTEKIETVIKLKDALEKNFDIDLFEKAGIKIVWDLKDLDQKALDIIEGDLLGDGCITKYGTYQQEAKDKKYLEWRGGLLNRGGIKCKIIPTKSKSSYSKSKKPFYLLYTHSCPAFFELRKRWYIKNSKGKEIKRIPPGIKLTPTALLHWYLDDGNLKHDKRPGKIGGRPLVRLFTNDFLREDIKLLLEKLKKDLDLSFYVLPKLNENIKRGYVLYLYSTDLFKFFKVIGFVPPKEIRDCVTEIRNGKFHTFKEKWPSEDDWIKILAKTKGIGKLLKKRRKRLGLTQRKVAEKIGVTKHHIAEIEAGRKGMSSNSFNKFLEVLKLEKRESLLATELVKVIPKVLKV